MSHCNLIVVPLDSLINAIPFLLYEEFGNTWRERIIILVNEDMVVWEYYLLNIFISIEASGDNLNHFWLN